MEKQKYFKFTNKEEIHNNFQFKDGLNVDPIPFNSNQNEKCVSGGIYFSKTEDILEWLRYDHHWIREVTIPEDAQIVEFKNKFRVDKIILGQKMALSDVETWKYLIGHGVNIHTDGDSALRLTAYNDHLEIVKFLVEYGADIHANDDYALRWAAINGHIEIVKYLKSLQTGE